MASAPPLPEKSAFWNWIDFLLFCGLLLASVVILAFISAGASLVSSTLASDQAPIYLFFQLGFYAAIFLAFWLTFRLRYGTPVWASLGWRKTVSFKHLALLALAGAVLSPSVSVIGSLLHTPEVHMEILDQLEKDPIILALFGVMSFTIGPIFEELLFRGFLQPLLSKTLGVALGILITSLLFGELHAFQYKFVWQYVAAVSCVGLALGIVRYKTGSIIASSVMHGAFNAVAATELFFHYKK